MMIKWLGWSASAGVALIAALASACGKAPVTQTAEDETELVSEMETEETIPVVEEAADGIAFDEITLVDDDTCLITVRSTDEDLSDGYIWQFHFENRTDEDLAFSVTDTAIGDYMSVADESGTASAALAAGGKTDMGLTWKAEDLEQMQVTHIQEVSFILSVFALKDGAPDYKLYEEVTVNNEADAIMELREEVTEAGESLTEASEEAVTEAGESLTEASEEAVTEAGEDAETVTDAGTEREGAQILLNQDGCLAVLESWGTDSFGDPVLNLYFENDTDQIVLFKLTELSIDGVRQDLKKEQTVLPGKKATVPMSLWSISLQEDGNADPQKVEGKFGAWIGSAQTVNAYQELATVEFVTEK